MPDIDDEPLEPLSEPPEPPPAEVPDPCQRLWDGLTEQRRYEILIEAHKPTGFSRMLWDSVPLDVRAAVEPRL